MQAIRCRELGPPSVMVVENVPIPEPAAGQVLVRVKAAGVNPVDTYIRGGAAKFGPLPLPYTPGIDAAGVIEKVGSGVKKVKVGDRVFVWASRSRTGTYAQYVLATEIEVYPLPDNASFEQGAAIPVPYFSAYRSLVHKAHLKAGQTVLIHGASGGVGVACLQIAKALGATVVGTSSSAEGRKFIEQYGTAFNHGDEGYDKEIAKRFPKIDVIVEMLANVNINTDLNLITTQGVIVIVGSRGDASNVTTGGFMVKECVLTGIILFLATDAEVTEMGTFLSEGLKKGTINPAIAYSFPLAKAPEAHEKIMTDAKSPGKIVLIP